MCLNCVLKVAYMHEHSGDAASTKNALSSLPRPMHKTEAAMCIWKSSKLTTERQICKTNMFFWFYFHLFPISDSSHSLAIEAFVNIRRSHDHFILPLLSFSAHRSPFTYILFESNVDACGYSRQIYASEVDDFGVRRSVRMRIRQFSLTRDNSIYVCILAMNLVHFSLRFAICIRRWTVCRRKRKKIWKNSKTISICIWNVVYHVRCALCWQHTRSISTPTRTSAAYLHWRLYRNEVRCTN